MHFDDILSIIGDIGPYQGKVVVLVAIAMIPEAMNSMVYVFSTADMDHWCTVDEGTEMAENCTKIPSGSPEYKRCIDSYRDAFLPVTVANGNETYSQCSMYDVGHMNDFTGTVGISMSNLTIPCSNGWTYDRSQYQRTIMSDFDMVCDQKHLVVTTQSIFYAGYVIGSWASGSLIDTIGRYYTFFLAVSLDLVSGVVMAFATNIWFYCACRFLVGVGNVSLYLTAFVIAIEILGPTRRAIGGIAIPTMFAIGNMFLALLAFLIRDWRYLQLVVSACMVAIFLYIPFLPESARWLMAHKQYEEAGEIVRKIAKNNKALDKLPENIADCFIKDSNEEIEIKERTYTSLDLLRQPKLNVASCILFFMWMVNGLIYFGIFLNTEKFGSNDYLAYFIIVAIDIPANLIVIPLIDSPIGRRFTIFVSMCLAGIACFTTAIASGFVKTIAAMLCKFFITISYSSLYIWSAEIFPTVVRGIGVGMCSTCGRIGTILGPIMFIMVNVWDALPLLMFCALAMIAGTMVFLLPETRGTKLTSTLAESTTHLRSQILVEDGIQEETVV